MVQLTDQQVDTIFLRIVQDGVTNTNLQHDLLDHYCCFIEEQMEHGKDFDIAYNNAFRAITPNGMHEIQEELFFLLTFKKQTNMKRIMYGSGFLATFLISTGFLFRNMHWDGAYYLFLIGFLSLIVTIITIMNNAFRHLKSHSVSYNSRVFIGLVAGLLISAGNLFKLHSFPGANMQIVIGMCLLNFVFMPMFFYHLYKQSLMAK